MAEDEDKKKGGTIVQRIPLWLAVAITVAIATPFAFHLGKYNLPLWLSFIVWAEYFALGANPSALKLILPSFLYGAIAVGLWLTTTVFLSEYTTVEIAFIIANFIWVSIAVYGMKWHKILTTGSLALFNGLSMTLGIYFTGSIPSVGVSGAYATVWLAVIWTVVAGYFGAFLGWLNVTITFPYVKGE